MGYIKLLIELAMLKHNVNVSRKKMQKIQNAIDKIAAA